MPTSMPWGQGLDEVGPARARGSADREVLGTADPLEGGQCRLGRDLPIQALQAAEVVDEVGILEGPGGGCAFLSSPGTTTKTMPDCAGTGSGRSARLRGRRPSPGR